MENFTEFPEILIKINGILIEARKRLGTGEPKGNNVSRIVRDLDPTDGDY